MIQSTPLTFQYNQGPSFYFPDFSLESGQALLILGKSGSGKSTWLQLLSGIKKPQSGNILIEKQDITALFGKKLDAFRSQKIGFIFQKHEFVPALNVLENLKLPFHGSSFPKEKAMDLAEQLGLGHLLNKAPQRLSQGEQQRLSILRAILPSPAVVLADEPSSSLDDENCEKIMQLLKQQCQQIGSNLIVVTHDQRIKDEFERRISL